MSPATVRIEAWLAAFVLLASPLSAQRTRPAGIPAELGPAPFAPVHEFLPPGPYEDVDILALAAGDLDADGDLDAELGLAWLGDFGNQGLPNALYLNDGQGHLRDLSEHLPVPGLYGDVPTPCPR